VIWCFDKLFIHYLDDLQTYLLHSIHFVIFYKIQGEKTRDAFYTYLDTRNNRVEWRRIVEEAKAHPRL
jgi:hypothetical protein